MISWKFVSAVSVAVVLAAAVTVPWAHQSQTIGPTTDAISAVGIARLEERIRALESMVEEKASQVKTALEAADRVTNKSFPSRTDFSELENRVGALETGAAGGAGRLGGVGSSLDRTLTAVPIGFSLISLLVVLFLAFGRRQAPRSPAGS